MRIGLMLGADRGATRIDGVVEMARRAETAGYDSLWMAHIRALDAIAALTVAVVVPPAFHPVSRTLWTAIDLCLRPLEPDEIIDEPEAA